MSFIRTIFVCSTLCSCLGANIALAGEGPVPSVNKVARNDTNDTRFLTGSLTLSTVSLNAGQQLTRSDTIYSAAQTVVIRNMKVKRVVISEADGSESNLREETYTLWPGQTLSLLNDNVITDDLKKGSYRALLMAEVDGVEVLLGSQQFTIEKALNISGAGIQGGMITTGAIIEEGKVYVWGFRGSSQQGNGTMVVSNNAAPAQVASLNDVTALTGGAYHLIALDTNGDVYGWGQSGYGETGCAPTQAIYVSTPCKVLSNATQIAAGEYFTVALDADGQVWTWGHNLYGQLGDGKTANSRTPVAVNLNGETARLIGGAYEGAFAVTEEGHVWAWGDNEASGLGVQGPAYGVQQIIRTPVRVTNLDPYAHQIIYIAGGNGWGEALLDDGTVIGWGLRASLGQGTKSTANSSPVPVTILTDVKQLYARYVGSVALRGNGEIYTWGQTGGSAFPMIYGAAPALRAMVNGNVTEVGGGKEHLFYKTEEGRLYGVGYNDLYKLDQSKCCAPIIDWPGKEIRMH